MLVPNFSAKLFQFVSLHTNYVPLHMHLSRSTR